MKPASERIPDPRVEELLSFSCGGNRAKVTIELRGNTWHLYTAWRRRPMKIDTTYYENYVWPRALMARAEVIEHHDHDHQAGAPRYLTPADLALRWRITTKSVLRLARADSTLPCIKLGKGKNAPVRFPIAAIERWEAARTQGRARIRNPIPVAAKSASQHEAATA